MKTPDSATDASLNSGAYQPTERGATTMFTTMSKIDFAGWIVFISIVLMVFSLIVGCGDKRKEEVVETATAVETASQKEQRISEAPPAGPQAREALSGDGAVVSEPPADPEPAPIPVASDEQVKPPELTPYEHYLKGLAYRNHGDYEMAKVEFGYVIQHRPNFWKAYVNLARTQLKDGQPTEALKSCDEALKVQPDSADAYNVRGLAYLDQGMYQEATVQFEKAIELDPKNAWPHNNLGLIQLRLGELDKALSHFKLAVERSPQTALMHNNLGVALEKSGEFKKAKAEYEKALQLKPDYEKAKISLARVRKLVPVDTTTVVDEKSMQEEPGRDESENLTSILVRVKGAKQ